MKLISYLYQRLAPLSGTDELSSSVIRSSVHNIVSVDGNYRLTGFKLRCYPGWSIRLQIKARARSQHALSFQQFLGIDAHTLPNAAFHISPFFSRSRHPLADGVHAFLLGTAQIIEQTHDVTPFRDSDLRVSTTR